MLINVESNPNLPPSIMKKLRTFAIPLNFYSVRAYDYVRKTSNISSILKKQIDFEGRRNWGDVDIGLDVDDSEIQQTLETLMLMVDLLKVAIVY
ncbi:hypothetical protein JTB14_031057 [Gonioctena quinquepunctata]|nr:hypothetical protein JTB14_031057 [Gonioctena quinquepunctata]